MVFSVDTETKKIVATIQNGDINRHYECSLLSCDNPVCTCDDIYLTLLPLEHENIQISPYKVDIDIINKKLAFKDKDKISRENLDFANLFLSKLDDADFQFLWEHYFAYKNNITEEVNIDAIEAHFDYREVEQDGLMYAYNDVLPYGDQLLVKIGGQQCIIFDQYCLLPKCSCTDATLTIFSSEKSDEAGKELYSVTLNYRKKKWKTAEGQPISGDTKNVRSAIVEQIPDIYKKLPNRHIKLKGIYAHCKKKHFTNTRQLHPPKVGRNDPCPCGSGKKYKKCCLGKSS
ncbi:MAG: SEC-C metal-binding domain-containing protein [Thermodesulfobacteriota bacterium]|nr:SEC-C metal-binding domain-containing protein [Thermodesulfobacteriota bacterium]